MLDGGAPLGLGRLNLVGQGRAGKTALKLVLEGRTFKETASTNGVEQQFMDVTRAAMDVGDGRKWKRAKNCDNFGGMSATQIAAQAAAKKCTFQRFSKGQETKCITELLDKLPDEHQVDSVQESNSTVSTSAFHGLPINRELVEQLANSEAEAVGLRISVWDFGGQEVFYALHHLHLTRFAAYAVLFDMQVCKARV
jgi:GTPase SAR1 family protein